MSEDICCVVAGLAKSQLQPEVLALAIELFGEANVWHGKDWEDFDRADDMWAFINANPEKFTKAFFVGHSLGVDQSVTSANLLGVGCEGVVLIEPVNGDKPATQCPTLIIRAANSFPFRQAKVGDLPSITIPHTNHNSVCGRPETLAAIRQHIAQCRATKE